MLGTGPSQISDGARDASGTKSNSDFVPISGQKLQIITPGENSDQDGIAMFTDSSAFDPTGIRITQRSYAWTDPAEDDFLIIEYDLENTSSQAIEGFYVGLFFDWDISLTSPDDDRVGKDNSLNLVYQYDLKASIFLGVALLTDSARVFQPVDNSLWLYNGFTKEEKYKFLSGEYNFFPDTAAKDWSQIISAGPFDIQPDGSVKAAFVIAGGRSLEELKDNISKSKIKYCQCVTGVEEDYSPNSVDDFSLGQNYPNPFNPNTTIPFTVYGKRKTESGPIHTTIAIYNILGQRVRTLLDETKKPGHYEVVWDGKDDKGSRVSSGIYFYQIKTQYVRESRRMILLK